MKFLNKVKESIDNINAKLNRGTKIGICSAVIVALLIGVIGIVNHNQQHETVSAGDVATCPVGITVSKAEKDRSTGCKIKVDDDNKSKTKAKASETDQAGKNDKEEEKEVVEATATPEATPSSKPEEKKEEAPKQNKPASNQQNNKPASSNKNTNQKSSNGSSKQNQSSQKSCRVVNHPAETHQEPVYQIVHHDEVSHMEDYVVTPAWDEQVANGAVYVCNNCGARFNTVEEMDDHIAISEGGSAFYHSEPVYQTIHHDAVMGQRKVVDKAAYDEKVQTGTKTVTDKAAWQETVCQ